MRRRPEPDLRTERLRLQLPGPGFAARMVDYYERNREHLARWEPRRAANFYEASWWAARLDESRADYQSDRGLRLALSLGDDPDQRVVGVTNLNQIVRGPFQACYLGYSLDVDMLGTGLMHEALERLLSFAFGELDLHRVMANYQPENERSARLLEKLGFQREGYARDYLFLDGAWRDHVLTSITNPHGPSVERS